ncbi:hypothetical protein [Silanimonas sp.]|jgi:hypothetical protein|uniref:hypothetical protein n=1 Tax=Silanimonas sp. TaxID=1929290 RepID=UPI0037C760E1
MPLLEDRTAAFIVRIWCESRESPGAEVWRGSIEHVGSGQRAYFRELDAVTRFLQPHIEALGVDPGAQLLERFGTLLDERGDDATRPSPPLTP